MCTVDLFLLSYQHQILTRLYNNVASWEWDNKVSDRDNKVAGRDNKVADRDN